MNLDNVCVGDIESDGLLDTISKIHVFSFGFKRDGEWQVGSTNSESIIRTTFSDPSNVIAMHNGLRFDVPAIEKVLKIKVKATIIDTLALAWYVDIGRDKYNLYSYGEFFGFPKPPIDDWVNLTYEEYKHRCESDIQITIKLWERLLNKLRLIYDTDEDIVRVIKYLNFIMECAYHQEEQKIQIDLDKVKANLSYFESLKTEKVEQLKQAMPKVPIKRTVNKPKDMYKKDGKLSVAGERWVSFGLPVDVEQHEIIVGFEDPNPNSVPQKKAWLYSLGWKPQTFSYTRDKKTGETKKIEQILTDEKELCPSVLKLAEKEPAIELLDGISVLTHRIGLLKSLLANQKDGYIVQGLTQLAVTLRWQHSVVVNFPRVTGKGDIRDGKWIRECLIAGKGNKIVQSDLSGIESRTSDHYTFPLDPDLVRQTQAEGFDPHTQIAVVAGLMTEEEERWYKAKKNESLSEDDQKIMDRLKAARHKAKTCNYASLYLVSAPTLARTLNCSKKEAQKLIDAYWKIHWAVKAVTETFDIRTVGDEMWILNPLSKIRYNLRYEKDAFSVVNQSSAVYCFNIWLYNITREGIWPILQTHDDLAIRCKEEDSERVKGLIINAIDKANRQLKMNVPLACEVQVGDNLAETH
jgi:hypothetical protein